MSIVVGFDVGNDTSCVALARKRGIDVIMNKESKRETPAAVNFGDKMRFLGTDGYGKLGLAPQNTVHELKRLMGKQCNDPEVQADVGRLPFKVIPGPDGGCLIEVLYCNEVVQFTPEQVMAMVLVDLKRIGEAEAGSTVVDATISVPTYYTESERYAMLNASAIAGLNTLRLMNETTATALAYGIYKTDLPENEAVHVAFVDVGHSSTQVSIVALKKNQLQVKSHAWDRNVGGRNFDEALFNHFAGEFRAKTKLDITTNKKASFKLRSAAEKIKKMLSANSEAPLNVECIMEDEDFRSVMTRDKFEELIQPVLDKLKAPMERALAESGVALGDISSVEVVGSSTRTPTVFKAIEEVFQKSPSRTMNSKECVSRGCALQCAMLSPAFKVREFEVIDAVPYSVQFSWDKDGTPHSQTLFKKGEPFPASKMISFHRNQTFKIEAHYGEDSPLPAGIDRKIGEYTVGPFQVPAGAENAKIKVKITMNLHGLVAVESAQSIEELEEEGPKDVKMEDAAAADVAPPAEGLAPMETEAPKADKKKKVRKVDVPITPSGVKGYTTKQLNDYFERECQMQAADRLQEETNDRKNALEGYVYDLRSKLHDSYAPFIKPADKDALLAALQSMEDWLYEEGEDTTKSVYIAKLEELKKLGAPVEQRASEAQARGPAAAALRNAADTYVGLARSDKPQLAHIDATERATVMKECEEAVRWLADKESLQKQLAKHDEPILLSSDILKKKDTLERVCKPIVTKPAPKAAPPPAAAAASPAADAGTPGPDDLPDSTEEVPTVEEPMDTDAKAEPEQMDI